MNIFSRRVKRSKRTMWQSSSLTDRGNVRTCNEDRVAFHLMHRPKGTTALAIVADGMGGHGHGDIAAEIASQSISRYLDGCRNFKDSKRHLKAAFAEANLAIHRRKMQDANLKGMGTTCTAALLSEHSITVAHVGDCRFYRIDEHATQITKDHTLVQRLVDSGKISNEEARDHAERNVIVRAVGTQPSVSVDIYKIDHVPGSSYLICSDGLYEYLLDDEIREIVLMQGIEKAPGVMVNVAKKRGGHDNISVLLVKSGIVVGEKSQKITQKMELL